jgi:hypothetical protein
VKMRRTGEETAVAAARSHDANGDDAIGVVLQ